MAISVLAVSNLIQNNQLLETTFLIAHAKVAVKTGSIFREVHWKREGERERERETLDVSENIDNVVLVMGMQTIIVKMLEKVSNDNDADDDNDNDDDDNDDDNVDDDDGNDDNDDKHDKNYEGEK